LTHFRERFRKRTRKRIKEKSIFPQYCKAGQDSLNLEMQKFGVAPWKRIPFLRILLPMIAGIVVQFYLYIPTWWALSILIVGVLLILSAKLFKTAKLFKLIWAPGLGSYLAFFALGSILVNVKDIHNDKNWIGNYYQTGDAVIITLKEPLVEKPKSYKAIADFESLIKNGTAKKVKGKLLVYFQKDSLKPFLDYGSQVLIKIPLQPILNSGNPGGFNYKRFCAFQDIHHQVFLKQGDYIVLNTTNKNWFEKLLIDVRSGVLSTLKKYIIHKNEVAVAEALLIGYRDDLDRELVQSYSNTGVVHIIAISGLHLGMIYGMLILLFRPFKHKKWNRIIQPMVILFVLWMFTFLAGAVPSILRSAVMFTCIVMGEMLSKRTSIYNTLAASAFILLLINPFYLWDVGFQLSFAAVLSIVAFSKYVGNWFYFKNKLLRTVWGLSAVTLSAQVLTLPVILYHFHQFPNLFLFTNLLIVPLSGLILFAELFLLIVSVIPFVGEYVGRAVEWLVWLMNTLIERTDRIPFAVTDGIQLSVLQAICIYFVLVCGAAWLLRKNKQMLFACCGSMIIFLALRGIEIIRINQQQKIIVYNIPKFTAIDVIEGNKFIFIGDSTLLGDGFLKNFHLRPSRIVNRIDEGLLPDLFTSSQMISSNRKKVIIIDRPLAGAPSNRIKADAIIITKNPQLYISQLVKVYDCDLLVFDATNPPWKIRLWKKDCDSLHLRHHSVPEQGAFEMDL
jgi:competence protein ComEC